MKQADLLLLDEKEELTELASLSTLSFLARLFTLSVKVLVLFQPSLEMQETSFFS